MILILMMLQAASAASNMAGQVHSIGSSMAGSVSGTSPESDLCNVT